MVGSWLVRPGDKVMLGDRQHRQCRFCGKRSPEVTFKKVAHAIPEALGNKSIETAYECDTCNEMFGQGIENDLGNWSKPMRTIARIRGKTGVPTIKKAGGPHGWRIEYSGTGFVVTSYEDDPPYIIDEVNKKITFKLQRDPYIPVAVLKAFMKMGLTLMPDVEVSNFKHLMAWVRCPDHSRPFADQCPIMYSFQPGPMPNDLIAAFILRRKPHVTDYPYAYFVLGYGNEVYQVQLPSKEHDGAQNGQQISIHPFPTPGSPFPDRFPSTGRKLLDLTNRELVKGETFPIEMGYETGVVGTDGNSAAPPPPFRQDGTQTEYNFLESET
jgi:hypothetical protein